jgi:thioredoxin reductase (NADPH)
MLSAHQQSVFFGAVFVFGTAVGLGTRGRERVLQLAGGGEVVARAVIIATGATYRRLGVPELESLIGRGVFYGATGTEAKAVAGQDVFVVGAGNSAGQAAIHLSRHAARVTLLVRGDSLSRTMSDYLIRELEQLTNVTIRLRTVVVAGHGEARLKGVTLENRLDRRGEEACADALLVLIGAQPRTEWLPEALVRDEAGYILTGPDFSRDGDEVTTRWPLQRPPVWGNRACPGVRVAVTCARDRSSGSRPPSARGRPR